MGMLHMVSEIMLQHRDLYGLNMKVQIERTNNWVVVENNMINIMEDFFDACCDNYIISVNAKYIYNLVFEMNIVAQRWEWTWFYILSPLYKYKTQV